MKKKKFIITILSVFTLLLGLFSININVNAYEINNDNELINTTNYCNLNDYNVNTDYTYTTISVENNNELILTSRYRLYDLNRFVNFDLSSLENDKYIAIVICNAGYSQIQGSTLNVNKWNLWNVSTNRVVFTQNDYTQNISNFNFTKTNNNSKLSLSIKYNEMQNNSSLSYKFYFYKYNDVVNTSNYLLKESLFDYMLSSTTSAYIDKELYDNLLFNYNQLVSGYNELGFLYYLDYWNSSYTDDDQFNISNYVSGSRLNLYQMAIYNNNNYGANTISLYFNQSDNLMLVGNLDVIFSGSTSCQVQIFNQDNDSIIFNVSTNFVLNQDYLISNDINGYEWTSINEIHFICNSPDDVDGLNFNVEYTLGYNDGYNKGYTYGYDSGNTLGYNKGYNASNVEYKQLYDNLVIQYNDLQELYNDYLNDNISFNHLVWNIATIPFESFKQIWNVDLLGLNLGNFVIALMFVGVVVYIWKKFI